MTARDREHQIFLEETRELGEILAMIRGHIRNTGRMPNIRQFLGDNGTPHRICNICGEIISINAAEQHGRRHEEWQTLDAENRTRIITTAIPGMKNKFQTKLPDGLKNVFVSDTIKMNRT